MPFSSICKGNNERQKVKSFVGKHIAVTYLESKGIIFSGKKYINKIVSNGRTVFCCSQKKLVDWSKNSVYRKLLLYFICPFFLILSTFYSFFYFMSLFKEKHHG